jgi:hypothetical protein
VHNHLFPFSISRLRFHRNGLPEFKIHDNLLKRIKIVPFPKTVLTCSVIPPVTIQSKGTAIDSPQSMLKPGINTEKLGKNDAKPLHF